MKLLIHNPIDNTIRVVPDSAIGRPSQPWFIPDGLNVDSARCALAGRIGRLGKGVSAKFASRYVDAVTKIWIPDNVPAYIDGAAVCGTWLEPTDQELQILAPEVELLSKYATLKTGDIVALVDNESPKPIILNSRISNIFHNQEVWGFNVK